VLMDIVYVLDQGILTDVNQLGGLDAYLARLEGIEEEKVIAEVKEDVANSSQQDLGAMLQQYNELYGSVNNDTTMGDNTVEIDSSPLTLQTDAIQEIHHDYKPEQAQPQRVIKPWTPTEDKEPVQMPGDSSLETIDPEPKKDSDVVINLH